MGRLRKLIPRFSLRTLVVFLLLVTSGVGLWWNWGPWHLAAKLERKGIFGRFLLGGELLTTYDANSRLSVWDAATARRLWRTEDGGQIVVAFTHTRSGPRLVTQDDRSYDLAIRDLKSGERLAILQGHNGPALASCFSPDGGNMVSAQYLGKGARLWDVGTGRCTATFGEGCRLDWMSFSPDGKRIISFGDYSVRAWDAESRRCLMAIPTSEERGNYYPLMSPDRTTFVTAGRDDTTVVSATSDGRTVAVLEGGHAASFSSDGALLATVDSPDGVHRVWDMRTLRLKIRVTPPGDARYMPAFSPMARYLTIPYGSRIGVWDLATGERVLDLASDENAASQMITPDETRALSRDKNGKGLLVRDLRNGQVLCSLRKVQAMRVRVDLSPDGRGMVVHRDTQDLPGPTEVLLYRYRPEWWGVFWLWEFWLTAVFAGVFVWSVVRDRKALRGQVA